MTSSSQAIPGMGGGENSHGGGVAEDEVVETVREVHLGHDECLLGWEGGQEQDQSVHVALDC